MIAGTRRGICKAAFGEVGVGFGDGHDTFLEVRQPPFKHLYSAVLNCSKPFGHPFLAVQHLFKVGLRWRETFVDGFGPLLGFGVLVVPVDEGAYVGFQLVDRGMDAALQFLSRKPGEPALDLIDPGCRGRRKMHMIARRRASQLLIAAVLWVA